MNDHSTDAAPAAGDSDDGVFQGQPHQIVERDGVRYTLLGTAHVSKTSVDVAGMPRDPRPVAKPWPVT